jgi:hypothetical protein
VSRVTLRPSLVGAGTDAALAWDLTGLTAGGGLVDLFGNAGTLTRAAAVLVVGRDGRFYTAGPNVAAVHHVFDSAGALVGAGVLTAPARTNLVTNPDTLTTAGGWTLTGTLVATAAGTFAGRALTLLNGATAGAVSRSVTFTGSTRKSAAWLVSAQSGVTRHVLYDPTADVRPLQLSATWTAGVPVVTAINGELAGVQRLADGLYLFVGVSDVVNAANAHQMYGSDSANATAAQVIVGGVSVYDSPIPPAVPYTYGATDAVSFPFAMPANRAVTVMHDAVPLGWERTPDAVAWQVGALGTSPALSLTHSGGQLDAMLTGYTGTTLFAYQAGGPTESPTFARTGDARFTAASSITPGVTMPVYGQRMRVAVSLASDGAMTVTRRYANGLDVVAASAGARPLPAAWSNTTLRLGAASDGSRMGALLHQRLVITPSVTTITQADAVRW